MSSLSSSSQPPPPPPVRATIGIISIGDMGLGIAKLLIAHGYEVVTSSVGRSQATIDRISASSIINLPSDEEFVARSDVILSIVPPRDAFATARRIAEAAVMEREEVSGDGVIVDGREHEEKIPGKGRKIFIDLNAVSPASARKIGELFPPALNANKIDQDPAIRPETKTASNSKIIFLDGGIIGGPPRPSPTDSSSWIRPSIPISGPIPLDHSDSTATTTTTTTTDHFPFLPHFSTTLNLRPISQNIGTASGLKCCFASLTKGLTALSILSFTTANNMGVLPQLLKHFEEFAPGIGEAARGGVVAMPPKAYRWVGEMSEISECFRTDGGFEGNGGGDEGYDAHRVRGQKNIDAGADVNADGQEESASSLSGLGLGLDLTRAGHVYDGFAEIYRFVAEGTVLGQEMVGSRKRGLSVEDVASAMGEGLSGTRKKNKTM